MSPIIEVIIGLMPADTDNGIAMTGIIARHGIEPGPEALSAIPMKNITAGIARAGTRLTTFFAVSSSVPFALTTAKRYVTPVICMKRFVLKPAMTPFAVTASP